MLGARLALSANVACFGSIAALVVVVVVQFFFLQRLVAVPNLAMVLAVEIFGLFALPQSLLPACVF